MTPEMSHEKRRRNATKKTQTPSTDHRVLVTGVLFFCVEVIVISGAYSPFRLPKMALALSGLALLVGFWFAVRLWRDPIDLPTGPLVTTLMALPALQTLSAVWAQAPMLALHKALVSLIWVTAAVWLTTFNAEGRWKILLWGVSGAVVSGTVLLGQLRDVTGLTIRGFVSGDRLGLTGLAGNPSDLAMGGLLFLPLLLPRALAQPQKWTRWLLPAFLAVTAVLTQALTGLAAVGLVGLGCITLMRSQKAWIAAAVLGITAILGVSASPLRSRIEAEWTQLRMGNWYNLLSARADGWTAALAMIEHSPILGVGAGQYSREFYPARATWLKEHQAVGRRGELATHFEWAHNDPLQLTSELGLLGVAWMVFFILAMVRAGPPGDPVIVLGGLAWTPFLLLHYPTHLAIGLIPAVLVLAHRLGETPRHPMATVNPAVRRMIAVAVVITAAAVCVIQVANLSLDRWRGYTEALFVVAENAPPAKRSQIVQTIESEAGARITGNDRAAPWLWRIVGRARLLIGAYSEAETAFRRSLALEPHEEAEMGLGLALAGQERTNEAIYHLSRACHVNPTLLTFITQKSLQESVRENLRHQ